MNFDKAAALVPHLRTLGISHLYASPVFTAVRGSSHGYDIVRPDEIDPALGGKEGLISLSARLKSEGLGLILDIVPNHLAASPDNPWWYDVVKWGKHSPYAGHFDIDWNRPLVLPFLGEPAADILSRGELKLALHGADIVVSYHGAHYPLSPSTYLAILQTLPIRQDQKERIERAATTQGDRGAWTQRWRTAVSNADHRMALAQGLERSNGHQSTLRRVLSLQPWDLCYWRTSIGDLNYRRFFDIAGLIGVRVEDGQVFADMHGLALQLVRDGVIDGLRIDHVDGLADPAGYLKRLRHEVGLDALIVVEKILAPGERLPDDWPADGTTGYEFMSALAGVFTHSSGRHVLEAEFRRQKAETRSKEDVIVAIKRQITRTTFAGELGQLATLAVNCATAHETLGRQALQDAICELIAWLPRYRTYAAGGGMAPGDRDLMQEVIKRASAHLPALSVPLQFICRLLVSALPPETGHHQVFRVRFQQLSGAVMAKSVEDTFFYRNAAYLAANEVGADPIGHAASLADLHRCARDRALNAPNALNATSTHDTKRGEDSRARLYALSEAPSLWKEAMKRWRAADAGLAFTPDTRAQWLFYQSLLAIWPAENECPGGEMLDDLCQRMTGFMVKAEREAKQETSWVDPVAHYERDLNHYVENWFSSGRHALRDDFHRAIQPFVAAGLVNSLSQTLLKLTAPGVPDIYQGTERLDLSLVDPDNRRLLTVHPFAGTRPAWDLRHAGEVKQWLIQRCLAHRSGPAGAAYRGTFQELQTRGRHARHVVAFARHGADCAIVVIVPRLVFGARRDQTPCLDPDFFADTCVVLPQPLLPGALRDVLSDAVIAHTGSLRLRRVLANLPVALLVWHGADGVKRAAAHRQ